MKIRFSKRRIIIRFFFIILYTLVLKGVISGSEKPLIFPIPQQMQLTEDLFVLGEDLSIVVPPKPDNNDIFLARFLVRELSDRYGIAVGIREVSDLPPGGKFVIMGRFDNPLVKSFCLANKLTIDGGNPGPEGYLLNVTDDRIVIAGSDDAGAFYGLQSLRQLIDDNGGKYVQGLHIKDWPSFPFRAIRLYVPGPENIAFFKRFMRDFMSLFKFNKVIMELNCMRLDRHPEVNAGWIEFSKYMQYSRSNSTEGIQGEEKNSSHYDAGDGFIIEKNDVRELVNYANENFLEVIPEIPSLTHGYYLLTRHPELAEYPGDRWPDTYCPSNPESYKLMFDVYDEYIEVIQPKMVHIGHDEWWGAPLGVCPLCKGKDFSELFAGDINKIHGYMKGKGIKIAMWGDYLLESVREKGPQNRISSTGVKYQTPGGTSPEVVEKSVPKDILIFNWFWLDQEKELELQDFGFKQIYGNFKPNISNWQERIKKVDLVGGAPSSWASTNEFNIGKDLILDFVGCANFVWSSHIVDQKELAGIVTGLIPSIRSKLNLARIPGSDGDKIDQVDISGSCNLPLNVKPFGINLNSLEFGTVKNGNITFKIGAWDENQKNIVTAVGCKGQGENTLPGNAKGIEINEDVSSLIFLHACALPSENQKAYFNIPDFFDTADLLGWYEIVYEDGFRINVPVQYGVNILEWNPGGEDRYDKREGETGSPQNIYCYKADPVICSEPSAKIPVTFFSYEWVNPRFGKKIREVNLFGTTDYQATQTNYGKPEYAPLKSNAIMLAAISKVIKRNVIGPEAAGNK